MNDHVRNIPPGSLRICEVGPRDGLQNEAGMLELDQKVAFVDALTNAGFSEIEVGSFVRPDVIPQLAQTSELFERMTRRPGVVYSALVPNQRGLERALDAKVDKVAVFTAASEAFSQANVNGSIAETLERFVPVIEGAHEANCPVRGYVSCVVACPYSGPIEPSAVRAVCSDLLDLGVDEIDLGETIGVATPADIERLLAGLEGLLSPEDVVLHLHDTQRRGIACARRAIELGVRMFDTAAGGLGGCPFAPGAAGNLATEDLVGLCDSLGIDSGVDVEAVHEAARSVCASLSIALRSDVSADEGGPDSSSS